MKTGPILIWLITLGLAFGVFLGSVGTIQAGTVLAAAAAHSTDDVATRKDNGSDSNPPIQKQDSTSESVVYKQIAYGIQDLVTHNPAALFLIGALLLMFATSLRLKVTRTSKAANGRKDEVTGLPTTGFQSPR